MSRLKRPSPALVISIMALVAAIVVPAYGALTKKDKRTVKNIANAEITKRAPGLAVASANTANSANTAGDTAEVHTPTRLVLNDPNPGDVASLEVDLLVAGPFGLEAECAANLGGNPNDDFADVDIRGPAGYSVAGVRTNGQHFDARHVDFPGGDLQILYVSDPLTDPMVSTDFHAVAPSGEVVTGAVSAELADPAGDCVFGATAIGP